MDYDILFFSAHPDDAEFGMGGTLIKLAKKYNTVIVVLSHGEAGTHGTPKEREKESRNAAKFAGAALEYLDFQDNHIDDNALNALRLASVIRKYRPKILFVPYHDNINTHYEGSSHPDHTNLGKLVLKAARFAKFKNAKVTGKPHRSRQIIYYMVPRYMKPSFIVDISDVIDDLKKLWNCHKSQLSSFDNTVVDKLLLLRRGNAVFYGMDYAEAFLVEAPLKIDIKNILDI